MVAMVSVSCCSLLKSCLVGGGVGKLLVVVRVLLLVVVVDGVDDVTSAVDIGACEVLVVAGVGGGVAEHVGSDEPPAARHESQASTVVVQLVTAQHVQQQLPVGAVNASSLHYILTLHY